MDIQNLYHKYKHDAHLVMPVRKQYEGLLISSLQQLAKQSSNPVFILLDAYDEFVNTKHEERERNQLLSCLVDLLKTSTARMLITTRPQHLDTLKNIFSESATTSEILGDIGDVRRYLAERMKDVVVSDWMRGEIISTILERNRDEAWWDSPI